MSNINRRKERTLIEREKIILLHSEGYDIKEISEKFEIPRGTIWSIINKYEKHNRIDNFQRCGRPKKITKREKNRVKFNLKKEKKLSLRERSRKLEKEDKIKISYSSVRRISNEFGIYAHVSRRKPIITKIQRKKRMEFSKKFLDWSKEDWSKILWSDETKINFLTSDGKLFYWDEEGSELNPENLNMGLKHGPSISIWACMSSQGVGEIFFIEKNLDSIQLIRIYRKMLKKNGQNLIGDDFIFQQDNDPKHTSKIAQDWLAEKQIPVLNWPPNSPDLSPIENLFSILKSELKKIPFDDLEKAKEKIKEIWDNISEEICKKSVDSMEERIEACFNAKGSHTKF